MGNPPFGHYGEDVIKSWFKMWFQDARNLQELQEQEVNDLINFDGNAQTLRIVSKLQILNDQYGVNFTYATLGTIMKYPWKSNDKLNPGKFGYFKDENELAERIRKELGLYDDIRHPATFLLEAADDIAYWFADIEDAVKKGILPWEKEYKNIKENLLKKDNDLYKSMFEKLDEQSEKNKNNKIPEENIVNIQNFKIAGQGIVFREVVEAFKDNYDDIMSGNFETNNLLKFSKTKDLINEMKRLAEEYCYTNKEVLTLELVGDTVIRGLLDIFVNEIINNKKEELSRKTKSGKLYHIISENFRYVCSLDYEQNKASETDDIKIKKFEDVCKYKKLLLITDFISGMTDSYAVNLYKELIGVELP